MSRIRKKVCWTGALQAKSPWLLLPSIALKYRLKRR